MNPKRMIFFGLVMALLMFALSEMFNWLLVDLFGGEKLWHLSPALAGFLIGIFQAAMVQMIRQKRQEMLGGQPAQNKPAENK